MISVAARDELAADLAQAERSRKPIAPLTAGHPEIDVVDAYEIQLINIRQRVAEGALVKSDKSLYPRVEVEVGFILAHDLPGANCTEDDVLAATEAFVPSIELIDTRITDWKIALCDTIADNASSAGFVLGAARVAPADIDIKSIDAVLTSNGELVAEGRSDAVLGNPVTAVAWLARKVESFGVRLRAGDIVLPGSCTRAIDARPGDNFVADFDGLGSVQLSFE